MNLANILDMLHEADTKRVSIFSKDYEMLLRGSKEDLEKVLAFNLSLCNVLEVRDGITGGKIIVIDKEWGGD